MQAANPSVWPDNRQQLLSFLGLHLFFLYFQPVFFTLLMCIYNANMKLRAKSGQGFCPPCSKAHEAGSVLLVHTAAWAGNTVHPQLLSSVPLANPGVTMQWYGFGSFKLFSKSINVRIQYKKRSIYYCQKFFFPFFIQKLKRSKYITLFTYCASCLEITEKEHTNILIRKMLHSLHLQILTVNTIRIGIQISFNISGTSKKITQN